MQIEFNDRIKEEDMIQCWLLILSETSLLFTQDAWAFYKPSESRIYSWSKKFTNAAKQCNPPTVVRVIYITFVLIKEFNKTNTPVFRYKACLKN